MLQAHFSFSDYLLYSIRPMHLPETLLLYQNPIASHDTAEKSCWNDLQSCLTKHLLTHRHDGENGGIMKKLYVAYGSNLNLAQMAARCPSASVYAKGVLNNWALVYRGRKANSHATIIKKQDPPCRFLYGRFSQ